jgi:hypothetical protein
MSRRAGCEDSGGERVEWGRFKRLADTYRSAATVLIPLRAWERPYDAREIDAGVFPA